MTFEEISGHASDIYRMAIESELTGWGFYRELDDTNWYPPQFPVDYPDGKLPSDIVTEVHVKHGDILNVFAPFEQGPDPESFDGPIAQLEQVLEELAVGAFVDPVSEDPVVPNGSNQLIQNVHDELVHWHGTAAETFRTNFLNGLEDKAGAQWTLAWVLLQSLRAERSIWQRAQNDVDKIAHDTIDAFKGAELHPTDKKATKTFSSLVDVAALFLPGLEVGVAIFKAATDVASLGSHQGEGAESYSPDYVAEIVSTMRESVSTVNTTVREKEEELGTSLRGVRDAVLGHRSDYVLPRPALAEAGNGHHQFGDNY